MPLPTETNTPWPPRSMVEVLRDMEEAAAWYAGDQEALGKFYGAPSQRTGRAKFWSRRQADQSSDRQRMHVPVAADVASTAADLLFGETPGLTISAAHGARPLDSDGQPSEPTADQRDAMDTEARLDEILELDGTASTLLEAAEIDSAIGSVYLRPAWDPEVAGHPMLTVIHGDRAVPEFRYGKLVAVTFWRELPIPSGGKSTEVWRHLERHERGVVHHGLFAGTPELLGLRRQLADHPDLAGIARQADETGAIKLPAGITGLLPRYVPNVLPNRKHRGMPIGRADTSGSEDLMDAFDETWTDWMRDIRMAKRRIIVPNEFLDRKGRGKGAQFDLDQEIFSPLEMAPAAMEKAGITLVDFAIRTEEHARTCLELFERIVVTAGYNPMTFGLAGDGAQVTATEFRGREGRTFRTTSKKQRYWRQAVEDTALNMLIIDADIFKSGVTPMRPRLDFVDLAGNDIRDVASTLNLINLAQSASIETRVKILHPDWDEPEVQAEVKRIKDEQGVGVTDPTGGFPA